MQDILICSMPALFVDRLPGAPAILKSAAEEAGFVAQTVDFSIDFFTNQCQKNHDSWNQLCCIFRPGETYHDLALSASEQWLEQCIKHIKSVNPRIIGLSVFTNFQHRSTVMLARELRRAMPDLKIILGGMGLTVTCSSLSNFVIPVKKIDMIKPFHQYMIDQGLADHTILGSGLDELVKILQKELGIPKQFDQEFNNKSIIFKTPVPNYDDYDVSKYVFNEDISLPITGSKGCVRACTFCDIPGQFGKFSFRSGEDIAKEMIELHKKYKVNIFEFTDSLVNGSFKAFKQWLTILADYNDTQSEENKLKWFGQYICRPQAHVPKDLYSLMARSGAANLVIGVESGSDAVLEAMKKQMTVKDVFDELEQFERYKIKCTFLMLSGFYNETPERYLETLRFLIDCQPYFASGTITKIGVGAPLLIFNDTYLEQEADKLGLILDDYNHFMWTSVYDSGNDFVHRSVNRVSTQLLIDALGYPLAGQNISSLHQVYQQLLRKEQELTRTLNDLTPITTDQLRLPA
jgi:radical SAM superfamily enzyme YgiQ (UPF0313 family)